MYYAQIDDNGLCFAVVQSTSPIVGENIIEVESDTYKYKQYDAATETWSDMPAPTPPTPAPTLEEIKENQLILMDAVATLFETVAGGA